MIVTSTHAAAPRRVSNNRDIMSLWKPSKGRICVMTLVRSINRFRYFTMTRPKGSTHSSSLTSAVISARAVHRTQVFSASEARHVFLHHLVQLMQLGIEQDRPRTPFLQRTFHLEVLCLSRTISGTLPNTTNATGVRTASGWVKYVAFGGKRTN